MKIFSIRKAAYRGSLSMAFAVLLLALVAGVFAQEKDKKDKKGSPPAASSSSSGKSSGGSNTGKTSGNNSSSSRSNTQHNSPSYSGGSSNSSAYTVIVADKITFSGPSVLNDDYSSLSGGNPIKITAIVAE